MKKSGSIIALIAGVFGLIAALVTLFIGGIGSAFSAHGADSTLSFGWGGIFYSFLVIIFGAIAISSKNRTPAALLVITSILGAILGGTLVAVFMGLSLIGGILAIVGTKPSQPLTTGARIAWAVVGLILLLVTILQFNQHTPDITSSSDNLQKLTQTQPSTLSPGGELADIFGLGSRYTDLQREDKLKEIKGQVVAWKLPVYEVKRDGNGYKIQTDSGLNLGVKLIETFIYLTPRDDKDRKLIQALKTGDIVTFKGIIDDVTLRNLDIKPAILYTEPTVKQDVTDPKSKPQAAVQGNEPNPEATTQINLSDLVNKSPEDALDNPALVEKFKLLLGDKLGDFRERLNVSSGIEQQGEWLVGEGGMQQLFSVEEAAFAVNSNTGETFAIMLTEGKNLTWFGTTDETKLPMPLQNWYKSHGGS